MKSWTNESSLSRPTMDLDLSVTRRSSRSRIPAASSHRDAGRRHAREPAEIGAALRDALQDAGGIFVKFGQLLSARTDLVPAAIALELSSLRDDVMPLPASEVLAVIERELGEPAEELFAAFDPAPARGRVDRAGAPCRLRDGGEVVVKVQRPEIEWLVERDLDILRRSVSASAICERAACEYQCLRTTSAGASLRDGSWAANLTRPVEAPSTTSSRAGSGPRWVAM
jgi:predicted unusual protein kinase regulating ubiquinone biosynthesis (AarF/ABC1/UbiB family)